MGKARRLLESIERLNEGTFPDKLEVIKSGYYYVPGDDRYSKETRVYENEKDFIKVFNRLKNKVASAFNSDDIRDHYLAKGDLLITQRGEIVGAWYNYCNYEVISNNKPRYRFSTPPIGILKLGLDKISLQALLKDKAIK